MKQSETKCFEQSVQYKVARWVPLRVVVWKFETKQVKLTERNTVQNRWFAGKVGFTITICTWNKTGSWNSGVVDELLLHHLAVFCLRGSQEHNQRVGWSCQGFCSEELLFRNKNKTGRFHARWVGPWRQRWTKPETETNETKQKAFRPGRWVGLDPSAYGQKKQLKNGHLWRCKKHFYCKPAHKVGISFE